MRSRNIKPGFFKNADLADIGPAGQLLFAGLFCLADREGRLDDRPKQIKVEVLPYFDCDVNDLLNKLQASSFITRYASGVGKYIEINNFKKHQHPHHREPESPRPAQGKARSRQGPARLIPDSLNLIPDSSIPLRGQTVVDKSVTRPETEIQQVVKGWKQLVGVPVEGPESQGWDKVHFKRHAAAAKDLLDLFGAPGPVLEATRYVYKHFTSQNLTCTLETVVKHSDLYRARPSQKTAIRRCLLCRVVQIPESATYCRDCRGTPIKPRLAPEPGGLPASGSSTPSAKPPPFGPAS